MLLKNIIKAFYLKLLNILKIGLLLIEKKYFLSFLLFLMFVFISLLIYFLNIKYLKNIKILNELTSLEFKLISLEKNLMELIEVKVNVLSQQEIKIISKTFLNSDPLVGSFLFLGFCFLHVFFRFGSKIILIPFFCG